ncbi:MAG: T9SS type A sorting domain-containing protein [Flavobacteriales bacterium]
MLRTTTAEIYAALALICAPFFASGQITVGQNEMPHANDELVRTRAFTNPFIDYATTGAAHVWDFSNLTVNTGDTAEYLTVASTNFIYAITYADLFFNPNRANVAKRGADIPFNQLLPIENPYTFYYRSPSTYKAVGFGVELSGIPVPIIFEDHDVIYELPVQFGAATSSYSSWNIDLPGLGYYGYRQIRANDVDGWGAITTPAGSFDVLRVNTTLTISDTIGLDSLGTGFAINRPIVHEYKWLAQGLRVPVLQINTTEIFGFQVVNAIYYYDVPRSIEVVQPLAATICPGATVSVPYEATGAYNAGGFLIQANHFTAQLSDASGDFTNPVDIGDTISTTSGSITATIPGNTPLGNGYRIRVISTSPDFIGTDNGFDITIGGATTAAISAGGPTTICTGDTLMLTAVGGPSYQWQLDGTDIGGATGASLPVAEAGDYTVVVDNACGSATSNTIAVEVNLPPMQELDTLAYTICAGATAQFTGVDLSGQSPLTFQWYLNNAPVPGETGTTIDASLAGSYTFVATNANTGCSFTTDAATLTVESVDAPLVSAAGDTIFCDGGSVVLDASFVPGATYQWYIDQSPIVGADSPSLVVDAAGIYTVVATNTNNCSSDPSISIMVVVNSLPDAPTINADGPLSFCDSGSVVLSIDTVPGATYQWSWNGSDVTGADSTEFTADATGMYSVLVTGANGCSSEAVATADVTENPLPVVPVISSSTDSLLATGSGSFQWYLDGVLIQGATDVFHIALANGDYTVTVTDANGCTSTSDVFLWLSTGIAGNVPFAFSLHPNPTNGPIILVLGGSVVPGALYEVLDVAGKLVQSGSISGTVTNIHLSSEAGVYVMRIANAGATLVQRIVVR